MSKNIILLFGGESNERLVSVASAQCMAQALGDAQLWFWHPKGPIYQINPEELAAHKDVFTKEFQPQSTPLFPSINDALKSPQAKEHCFVLGLHGGSGENGFVQKLFEDERLAFTGSDAQSSKNAFDKLKTKQVLRSFPIKLAAEKPLNITNKDTILKEITDFLKEYGAAIIKPVRGGSSLGCYFLYNESNIDSAIENILNHPNDEYFCEQLIKGREFTVGVIDGPEGPRALPITEVVMDKERHFDYEGKYLGAGSKELTPADLSEMATGEAQRLAVAAHVSLSLYGYSRTDLILGPDGFYFLEINTLPGLTTQSFIPQQLAADHISMREFLTEQIALAKKRAFSHKCG